MTILRIVTSSLMGGAAATVNLIWHNTANPNYMLTRGDWAPTIPALRTSPLSGAGPYADVEEEIGVNVYGQTAAECLSNLDTLARLLDQADRWHPRRGENVAAVRLQYTPTGGSLLAECVILGRASGDETSGVRLPLTFNRDLGAFLIEGVRLRFRRRGLLLNPTPETASSSVALIPTVQTATLASTLFVSSPTKLTYAFTAAGVPTALASSSPSFVLAASAANRLQIYEGEAGALTAPWTVVADAGNLARGGSVLRFSPAALTGNTFWTISGLDSTVRRLAVWAAVRNNSTTTVFTLRPVIWSDLGIPQTIGPITTIDTSTLNPRLVFLGIMSLQYPAYAIEFDATASAAAGSLDIDYLVIHAVDDETSATIALYSTIASTYAAALTPGFTPTVIDPRPLSAPTALVTAATSPILIMPYAGDPMIMSRGTTVAAVWLGTGTGVYWRPQNGLGTAGNGAITAERYNAYLTPR